MADIKYLNYGNQQVDEQALLTSMANDVQKYVNSKSWSKKRKEKFMNAYSDLIGRGLLGASNDTGQWYINVEKGPITYGDKKDEQMYGEAAYFIQQQMNRLATTPEVAEEAKPQEETQLTSYGDSFGKVFGDYIKRTYYGNQDFHIGGEKDDWNVLDSERDEYGRRGKNKRALKLAEYLENYKNSLTDNTYDFKDSPFNSLEDLKNKLDRAITSLRNENIDQEDIDSLNVLGLDARDWFNDGSGEDYVDEFGLKHPNPDTNKYYTYAEWYGLKRKEKEAEDKKVQEEENKKAQENALKEVRAKMNEARRQAEETFNQNLQIPITSQATNNMSEDEHLKFRTDIIKKYQNYLNSNLTNKPVQPGEVKFDDGYHGTVKVEVNPNAINKYKVTSRKGVASFSSESNLKWYLRELFKTYGRNRSKNDSSTVDVGGGFLDRIFGNHLINGVALSEFDRLGWLKQGGKITSEQIDKFLQQWK